MRTTTTAALIALLIAAAPQAGQADASPLEAFEDLVGGRWRAEGTWESGQPFIQEVEFRWDLGQTIVIAERYGPVEPGSNQLTHRNHGIRAWLPEEEKVWFWEFDVYGGLTQGEVRCDGTTIYLTYEYGGGDEKMHLGNTWTRVDANTYDFSVRRFEDGKWGETLLKTQFRRIPTGG